MSKESLFKNLKSCGDKPTQKIIPGHPLNRPVVDENGLGEIGLELELEGDRLPSEGYLDSVKGVKSKAKWTRKTDGSLRGGYEYVLTSPCLEEEVPSLMNGFFDVLKSSRTTLNLSNRCSTHVHLNVGGYKINELTSLIALWYVFETSLINWCGLSRKANHFCLSHKESTVVSNQWNNLLQSGLKQFGNVKYSALNIVTLNTFGSLEFRCMGGAENAQSVINWSLFLRSMQKYCKVNFQNPFDIAFAISERGPEEILRSILKDNEPFFTEIMDANRDENFAQDCMEGFRSFQQNVLGYPWEECMEEINSVYVPNPFKKTLSKEKTRVIRPIRRLPPTEPQT